MIDQQIYRFMRKKAESIPLAIIVHALLKKGYDRSRVEEAAKKVSIDLEAERQEKERKDVFRRFSSGKVRDSLALEHDENGPQWLSVTDLKPKADVMGYLRNMSKSPEEEQDIGDMLTFAAKEKTPGPEDSKPFDMLKDLVSMFDFRPKKVHAEERKADEKEEKRSETHEQRIETDETDVKEPRIDHHYMQRFGIWAMTWIRSAFRSILFFVEEWDYLRLFYGLVILSTPILLFTYFFVDMGAYLHLFFAGLMMLAATRAVRKSSHRYGLDLEFDRSLLLGLSVGLLSYLSGLFPRWLTFSALLPAFFGFSYLVHRLAQADNAKALRTSLIVSAFCAVIAYGAAITIGVILGLMA